MRDLHDEGQASKHEPAAPTHGDKLRRRILAISTLGWSWLGMMIVHEFGHVLGLWMTGGTVAKVVLYPTCFSRTDAAHNPHPLIVAWAGPALGVLLPLAGLGAARLVRMPGGFLLRFFAGFCLVANGAYLGVGWVDEAGDAGDLLRYGASIWQLCGFGLIGISLGLYLWHGTGLHFGLGRKAGSVHPLVIFASLALFMAITIVELLVGGE